MLSICLPGMVSAKRSSLTLHSWKRLSIRSCTILLYTPPLPFHQSFLPRQACETRLRVLIFQAFATFAILLSSSFPLHRIAPAPSTCAISLLNPDAELHPISDPDIPKRLLQKYIMSPFRL